VANICGAALLPFWFCHDDGVCSRRRDDAESGPNEDGGSMLRRCHFSAFLAVAVIAAPLVAFAANDPESAGVVDKVEHQAEILTGGDAVAARVGIPCASPGRASHRFEKASIVIDRYIYDPRAGVGETMLQATRGALSSGAARLTTDMACCCWKARSWSPIKPAALCCRGKAKAPTSPLRSIRPVPFEPGASTKSPAPWPP
jgi:hypothetical protein